MRVAAHLIRLFYLAVFYLLHFDIAIFINHSNFFSNILLYKDF